MRYKGKLIEWHDEQGYGFIEPIAVSDGKPVFLHIKSFRQRGPRPLVGCLLEYELARDAQGRLQAYSVNYVRSRKAAQNNIKQASKGSDVWHNWLMITYLVYLLALVMVGKLHAWILAVPFVLGLITYIAYSRDKHAAKHGGWRTPETTLHLLALLGGWCGAIMAQRQLRHKTVKAEFRHMFWMTVIFNIAGITAWALWGKLFLVG